jgi:hypothetical protein
MSLPPLRNYPWRSPRRPSLPALCLAAALAPFMGNAAESVANTPTAKPAPTTTDGQSKDRDHLNKHQEVAAGSPPAAPSKFSPDPSGLNAFPEGSRFREVPRRPVHPRVRETGPTPQSPVEFNPDPGGISRLKIPRMPPPPGPWRMPREREASPVAPSKFNPDPGVRPGEARVLGAGKMPFGLQPTFGLDPLKPPVNFPRGSLRKYELSPSLERRATQEDEPLIEALPRKGILSVEPESAPFGGGSLFGEEPLPPGRALPRRNTRRNLRVETHFESGGLHPDPDASYPPHAKPRPNRYRVPFMPWRRYTGGSLTEQPFGHPDPALWHWYRQSVLKGDVPIIGQDIFLNLTAFTSTEFEAKRVPTPSMISAAVPGQSEFFGRSEQISIQNNLAFSALLFRGETAFKPLEWEIKLTPIYNLNYLQSRETGIVSPDPRGFLGGGPGNNLTPPGNGFVDNPVDIDTLLGGQLFSDVDLTGTRSTERTRDFWALQEASVEIHLKDLSSNYDFIAFRGGNQLFTSDFRGFIFNDINLGYRLFGNYWNNRIQYNFAGFSMREKDTNSELNTFDERGQEVVIANVYWQDFIVKGYTATASFHANFDEGDIHYDRNGAIVRPAPLGTVAPHDVDVYYLGWGGDGHIGRLNISHQFYQALGRDELNGLAGRPVDINGQFAAMELSYDRDWIRYKASFIYASGDADTEDGTATGFDTILDNPNFIGGPFSYYLRQGFNLGGTVVNFKQRSSLIPNLRTSKTQGQANFVNPGLYLWGLGVEIDVTPKLKSFINVNYIRMAESDPVRTALLVDKVDRELGWDFSLGFQYRPMLTDNVILSAGFGAFLPGRGYKDIYRRNPNPVPGFQPTSDAGKVDSFLYSGLIALNLAY